MKKILVMVAAAMMVAVSASAQSRFEAGTVTIQPKLGGTGAIFTNAPKLSFGDGTDLDKKATDGVLIGAELEYQLSDFLSIAGGVNWAQAGSGWDDYNTTVKGVKYNVKDIKIESSYIIVPLVLNAYLFRGFAVKAGAQIGFLTSAKEKMTATASENSSNLSMSVDEDCKDAFNKVDVSIPVGVSYEFPIPIVLDLRVNVGVTKVNKESYSGYKDFQNIVAAFTVGYKFKL
jgi:hypothetical protein